MKKIVYSRPDGGVSIVLPAPKEQLERKLGKLTEEEYVAHVIERSIPENTAYRFVEESDIPASREFRDAWVDKSSESRVDICCEKARDIGLKRLRFEREEKLSKTDIEMTRSLESNDQLKINNLRKIRQDLRDSTEPLKRLDVKGKLNDEKILQKIRDLSKLS